MNIKDNELHRIAKNAFGKCVISILLRFSTLVLPSDERASVSPVLGTVYRSFEHALAPAYIQ